MPYVTLDTLGAGIQLLTWSNPEQENSLSLKIAEEFSGRVSDLKKAPPRVVIVTAAGSVFSSNRDNELLLNQSQMFDPNSRRLALRSFFGSFLSLLKMKIPILAAINGDAVGPGLFLACACDYRLADRSACLGADTLPLGLYPVLGATLTVPRLVGPGRALEIFSGRKFSAQEAYEIGLVDRLTDKSGVLSAAREFANRLVSAAPKSTQTLLEQLRPREAEFAEAIRHETDTLNQCLGHGDFRDAWAARQEGRSPRWVPEESIKS